MIAPFLTAEEYLRIENEAEEKSDWVRGKVMPMAGAGPNHRRITPRLSFVIQSVLVGDCRYLDQDTRIAVPGAAYYYPDGAVGCPPEDSDAVANSISNPRVIFEVLSPESELRDRTTKFEDYARLPSLEEYVLIASESPNVQVFRRLGPGEWSLTIVDDPSGEFRLASLDTAIPLAELYRDVRFA